VTSILPSLRPLARGLRKNPSFFLIAVLTLAVGIGANAAIFSVVDAVLIRPLPYPQPERLVAVWHTAPGLNMTQFEQSDATYLLYRRHNRTLQDLGIYDYSAVTLTGGQEPERVTSAGATASLFSVLRAPAAVGRRLLATDERPGAEPVVVLSHGLWRRRFGADPKAVGTLLRIDGVARRVVGVMPAGFHFPTADTELWLPFTLDPAHLSAGNFNYEAVARLRPGVAPRQAARELSALVWRLPEASAASDPITRGMIQQARLAVLVHPLRDDLVGQVARTLWVLLGSVGLILLIACANVANLFLVRAEARQREMAVRTALGATRRDVFRLFLSESLALSLSGAAIGLALAALGVRALLALRPQGIPRLEEIGVDLRVVGFGVLLALFSGLLVGLFAALRFGAPELMPALKEGGRGGAAGRARHRARKLLVVAQVALALVLLVGAGLMVKSFWRLQAVDPGIAPRGVLTVRLDLPDTDYPTAATTARFVRQLLERVRALPGVAAAGTVDILPLGGGNSNSGILIEDFPLPPDAVPPILACRYVSPGYFETMRIPLLAGRTFDAIDPGRRSDTVVVSAALAHRFWHDQSPLGKRLVPGLKEKDSRWYTIVGVVGSVRDLGLERPLTAAIYFPVHHLGGRAGDRDPAAPRNFTLVVRGRVEPLALVPPVRAAVRALDPNLPLSRVRPMAEVVARSMVRTSFTMLLLVIAACVALLLGAVGIYGVISYVVSQRTGEIGVRMALGARRRDIARMVLGEGLLVSLAGIALGLAGALAITRLLVALLFEVSPTDPATFVAVPAVLAAVALFASYLPAQRAAEVEPLAAIRYE
jgi:putative ABC transport system permease protein